MEVYTFCPIYWYCDWKWKETHCCLLLSFVMLCEIRTCLNCWKSQLKQGDVWLWYYNFVLNGIAQVIPMEHSSMKSLLTLGGVKSEAQVNKLRSGMLITSALHRTCETNTSATKLVSSWRWRASSFLSSRVLLPKSVMNRFLVVYCFCF